MLTEIKHSMPAVNRGVPNHNVARLIAAQQNAVLHRQFEFFVIPDQCPPIGLADSARALPALEHELGVAKADG